VDAIDRGSLPREWSSSAFDEAGHQERKFPGTYSDWSVDETTSVHKGGLYADLERWLSEEKGESEGRGSYSMIARKRWYQNLVQEISGGCLGPPYNH
jgi:hypothetical protein